MSQTALTRREWLGRSIVGLTVLGVAAVLPGCGGEEAPALDCTNPPGLDDAQRAQRTAMQYKDRSPDPFKTCEKCSFFTAAGPEQCGGCTLNLGAVNPRGTCMNFAPKA